jgi:hypothetical protein
MKKEIRTVDQEKGIAQITTFDERWYTRPVNDPVTGLPSYQFVPSVTWIAGHYPKGVAFYKWLAEKGWDEAEAIKHAAADKGSKIHQAIKDLVDGKTIAMDARYPGSSGALEELTVEEYEAIMSFADWFSDTKPEVLTSEYVVFSDEFGYAGTVDLKCRIEGKTYIVDFKSGQHIWPEYELQLSAYKHAEAGIDALAVLQVGYKRNKKSFKFTEIEDKFPLFLAAKQIWANECAGQTPSQKDYPLSISLSQDTQEPQAPKVVKKPTKQSNARGNVSE